MENKLSRLFSLVTGKFGYVGLYPLVLNTDIVISMLKATSVYVFIGDRNILLTVLIVDRCRVQRHPSYYHT